MNASSGSPQTARVASESLDTLRASHQVRPLQPEEEGCALGALPQGVFGYTYAPGFDEVPLFSKKSYHSFEVHKAADGGEYLIGFVTSSEGEALDQVQPGAQIHIFPDPWESANRLASVPFLKILAPKRLPPREDGNPFVFTIV